MSDTKLIGKCHVIWRLGNLVQAVLRIREEDYSALVIFETDSVCTCLDGVME